MFTEFRVRAPSGRVLDVVADIQRSTTIRSLAEELQRYVAETDFATIHQVVDRSTLRLVERPGELDPDSPVSSSGLRRGDLVEFTSPGTDRKPRTAEVDGTRTLMVIEGPDAGVRMVVSPGVQWIGRGNACDVRLSDPSVSRRHCELTVGDHVEVAGEAGIRPIRLDGAEVIGSRRWPTGGRLDIGSTVIVLAGNDAQREVNSGCGAQLMMNRPPRVIVEREPVCFRCPGLPSPLRVVRFPWITVGAAIAMGAAIVAVGGGELRSGIFYLMMPILVLAGSIEARFSGRSEHRQQLTTWRQEVMAQLDNVAHAAELELRTARRRHPSGLDVASTIGAMSTKLWERQVDDTDFLSVRLGTSSVMTSNTIDVADGGEASLREELSEQIDEFRRVEEFPVWFDIARCGHLGIAGRRDVADGVARSWLLQLAGLHSPVEVALAALLGDPDEWNWMKWLPHVRTASTMLTGPALGCARSVDTVLSSIEVLVQHRRDQAARDHRGGDGAGIPRLVVLYDGRLDLDRVRLTELLRNGPSVGVHAVWIDEDVSRLPAHTEGFVAIDVDGITGDAFFSNVTHGYQNGDQRTRGHRVSDEIMHVELDVLSSVAAERAAFQLAPLVDASHRINVGADLPMSISLPEATGAPRLLFDPALLIERWTNSLATELIATVGVLPTGSPVSLDLRRDGPHAIVAGTTGAGKSEFLQTLISSLAANLSPTAVNFLLIDYKGGAAFMRCADLPHTVGLVTDLDSTQVRRVLISLEAELRRREAVLARAGAKDIIELSRRSPATTPPALIIVIDEFAALTREIPEFVDGVVNIAQRGRSLGLHLVLATQRPAGVISDNIRANTNLRIALRTADSHESLDVIGTPLAGQLPRTAPGRGVIRIGSSEPFTVQFAHVGMASSDAPRTQAVGEFVISGHEFAIESADGIKAADTRDRMISSTPFETPTDLQRLVETARAASAALGLLPARRPWLDPLPEVVDLDKLGRADRETRFPLALVDRPDRQEQTTAWIDLAQDGHLLLIGASGAGKTTALVSIACALSARASRAPMTMYGIDASGGSLRDIEMLPEVGSILSAPHEPERVVRLLRHLADLVERRPTPNGPDRPTPVLHVLFVDDVATFHDQFDNIERGLACDLLKKLLTEGQRGGVHVVMTQAPRASLGFCVGLVTRHVTLGLDDGVATGVSNHPAKSRVRGRALIDGNVAQIGVVGAEADPDRRRAAVAAVAQRSKFPRNAPVPRLPTEIRAVRLPAPSSPTCVTIGVNDLDLSWSSIDLEGEHFCIFGSPRSGKSSAMSLVAHQLHRADPGRRLLAVLARPDGRLARGPWEQVAVGPAAGVRLLDQLLSEPNNSPRVTVGIDDLPDLSDEGIDGPLVELLRRSTDRPIQILATGDSGRASGWSDALKRLRSGRTGLLLVPHLDRDGALLDAHLPTRTLSEMTPGRGFLITRSGSPALVQLARLDGH